MHLLALINRRNQYSVCRHVPTSEFAHLEKQMGIKYKNDRRRTLTDPATYRRQDGMKCDAKKSIFIVARWHERDTEAE